MTADEFINDRKSKKYDLDNPLENPKEYLKYKRNLEDKCMEYTGYDSGQSYMGSVTIDELVMSPEFINTFVKITKESFDSFLIKNLWEIPETIQDILNNKDANIANLKKEVENLKTQVQLEQNPGIKVSSRRFMLAVLRKLGFREKL